MKEKKYQKKLKLKNSLSKLEEKEERKKQLEINSEKQRKEILKKIDKMVIKKEEYEKKKEKILIKNQSLQQEHFRKLIKNKLLITQFEENRRENILMDESEKLNRGINKDFHIETKRIKAHMSLINSQIEYEEGLKSFKKRINSIQDESILKKTPQEKYNLYIEKLRRDEEKRKKEAEAKLEKNAS